MSYENRRLDVAVFIDFENVYVSVRDKLNANPNFEAIMDRCSDLGRVVIARAYADWYRYPRVTSALYANAIEPIYVATYYYDKDMGRTGRAIKNSVDMNLCIDAMKTLFTNTNINRFVLVTGDRDFIPLVNSIRQQGKEVYIIGIGGAASTHLAQSADEFVFYEQLVGKQPAATAAAAAIANRATELTRGIEAPEPTPPPVATPVAPTEVDVYDVLVEAIHLVRKRGYVSTLGSIKLVMKELMGGDFKESRYKDLNGRPFAKFKDFVVDAEKRGKVQIFTNGTVNEVFLPGEDPYKLSQFAAALSEEATVEPVVDAAVTPNGRKESSRSEAAVPVQPTRSGNGQPAADAGNAVATGRRRRRRSRRGQGASSGAAEPAFELVEGEVEAEDLELTPPLLDDVALPPLEDELVMLDDLEQPAELAALYEEQPYDELSSAQIPDDLLSAIEDFEAPVADEFAAISEEIMAAPEEIIAVSEEVIAVSEEAVTAPDEVITAPEEIPAAFEEIEPPTEEIQSAPEAVAPLEEPVATEPELLAVEEAVEAPAGEEGEELLIEQHVEFSPEEWDAFRGMMRDFAKPVSFQQIFDSLRGLRKDQNINRTNEQLRTMVKQAINSGLLERSGRGKRVYYSLKAE